MTGRAAAMPTPGPLPHRLSYGRARESPVVEPAGNFLSVGRRRYRSPLSATMDTAPVRSYGMAQTGANFSKTNR